MSNIVDQLVEMGFDKQKAALAVAKCPSSDVQDVMDYLLSHEDELQAAAESSEAKTEPEQAPSNTSKTNPVPKSIRCDDCGKLFTTNEEVEFHASKSGHENFSESTDEKKPLTEEEKKEQLAKIEAKLRQRRLEREAREKEEQLEKEKNRIKSGKELLEAKKKHEELEMKKIVEQRKREKEEERLARQRVREQIEQDKLARKAKFGGGSEAPPVEPVQKAVPSKPTSNYNEVKLQIRLTNGQSLAQTFGAKEPLSSVRLYVEMNRSDAPGPFGLMTNFPRKVFSDEDYDKPLDTLGLAPTATLIVTKQ